MGVLSSLQAIQNVMDPSHSYWKVLLTTGKEITEHKLVFDFRRGGYRPIDWALDLNATGDLLKIKELWLICPNGQQVKIDINEPGTAIQFKHKSINPYGAFLEAQGIGKVTDKGTGDCECWIWDRFKGLIPYKSNIDTFGTWREGLMPLTKLSREVIGLQLD